MLLFSIKNLLHFPKEKRNVLKKNMPQTFLENYYLFYDTLNKFLFPPVDMHDNSVFGKHNSKKKSINGTNKDTF